jgi:hypothetical protein
VQLPYTSTSARTTVIGDVSFNRETATAFVHEVHEDHEELL